MSNKGTAHKGRAAKALHDMPLMRAFFLHAAACLVVSVVASLAFMLLLMNIYGAMEEKVWEGRIDVSAGPYVYDAQTDDLIPAVSIEIGESYDRTTFLGMRDSVIDDAGDARETINAMTGAPVGYATLDMLKNDDAMIVYDWGSNYTEQDYKEAGGNPYELISIDGSNIAAYDARERAERAPVDAEIAKLTEGNDDFVVSNIAYYVSLNTMSLETPIMTGLRIATGLIPFIVLIVFAILFFRRFYRRCLDEPLQTLHAAADRVARQDLDFVTPEVTGRELGRLRDAFEKMRASLESSQRELWRTAEERRRLNAAFAHDLRTPITVLKGTVEMMQMRAEQGLPASSRNVGTLTHQIERLESYAQAMSGIARLEDRKVVRSAGKPAELAAFLRSQAQQQVSSSRPEVALGIDEQGMAREDDVFVDRSIVEEVLGNLLGNACGHARGRVTVRLVLDGEGRVLTLRVADDGPGFTPEALRRGCEPFFGEAKDSEHFGLGLNIVQTLTRLHGGTVELANDEEGMGGAAVTVTFDVTDAS